MGIKPKAIARIGSRSVLIPFPTKGETPLAPPIPLAPHEPTGVTTSVSSLILQVTVSWTDASTDEDGFYVYRNTSNTTTGATLIATLGAGVQTYVDNDDNSGANAPAEGTTYYYWVSSFNAGGESVKSPAASNGTGGVTTIWLVPTAPSSLSATAVSSSQINLSWTDNSNNETGFEIFRSTDGITFSSIATVGAGVTTYNSTGLSASTQYYYKVWAYNPGENSTYSNTANATTQAAAGIPAATYDLDFTTNAYVGAGGRFARSSRGTFVNSSGFIQTAEMNMTLNSEDMSLWNGVASTVTVNAITAPDGSLTADRIVETTATERHARYLGIVLSTANVPHTVSFYVKKDTRRYVHAQFNIGGGRYGAIWDLDTGSVSATLSSGGFTNTSSTITAVGNGWHRVTLTGTFNGTSSNVLFGTSDRADFTGTLVAESPSFAGSTTEGMYVWGVQVVQSSSALPYVRTTTTAVGTPRITHDPVTLAPLGLLMEPAATNQVIQSNDFNTSWTAANLSRTASATTSPDGLSNGWRLVENNTNSQKALYQAVASQSNAVASVYAKADQRTTIALRIYQNVNEWIQCTFNLSAGTAGTVQAGSSSPFTSTGARITAAGNGWYRCELRGARTLTTTTFISVDMTSSANPTLDPGSGVEAYTGNGTNGVFVFGAQLEGTNSEATSYIPTIAATVTRSADGWNLLGTDMATIWNQSQGSLVASGRPYTPFTSGGFVRVGVSASNANGYFTSTTSFARRPSIRVAGVNYGSGPTGAPTSGEYYKSGYAYNQATPAFTGFVNGTAGTTLTNSLSGVTMNKLELGTRIEDNMNFGTTVGTTHSVYIVERMRYWNTKLSDADMVTLTT